MTADNWFAVGLIVATILAPIVKVFFEFVLKRRTKTKGKIERGLKKRPRINWHLGLNLLYFLAPSTVLIIEAFSTDPVTRYTVFIVSLAIASLFFLIMMEFLYQVFVILRGYIESHTWFRKKVVNILNSMLDSMLGKNLKRPTRPSTGRAKAVR